MAAASLTGAPVTGEQPPAALDLAGAGHHVLMLHGWGAERSLWRPLTRALEPHFTVLAMDFPGFGATPPPPVAWDVDAYARWTLALLDRLGIAGTHIVAHSFGGRVAVRLATMAPDRVGRLVLAGTSGILPRRGLQYHLRVRSYKALKMLAAASGMPAFLRVRAAALMARRGSPDWQAAQGTVRRSFVRIVNEDFRDELPRVAAPTLLIWGARDQETPLSDARLIERLIPDAGLVVFDGCGHYAFAEQPQRFCRIVDVFLAGPPV